MKKILFVFVAVVFVAVVFVAVVSLATCGFADVLKNVDEEKVIVEQDKKYQIVRTQDMTDINGQEVTVVTGINIVTLEWLERRLADLLESKTNYNADIDKQIAEIQAFIDQINSEE